MKPLRVGVIGAGRISQAAHLPRLMEDTEKFAVACLADLDHQLCTAVADRFGIQRSLSTMDEVLDVGVDAIVIATPWSSHAGLALQALHAGVGVLCEKPLALSLNELDILALAAESSPLQVGYMRRFDEGVRRLIAIAEGAGDLRSVAVEVWDPDSPRQLEHLDLILPKQPSLGAQTSHDDISGLVTRLAGGTKQPDSVRAYTRTLGSSLVHDVDVIHQVLHATGREPLTATSAGWWDEGASVTCSAVSEGTTAILTRTLVGGNEPYRCRHVYHFENTMAAISFPNPYVAFSSASVEVDGLRPRSTKLPNGRVDKYRAQLDAFYLAITNNSPVAASVIDAKRDVCFLQKAFQLATDARK